MCLLPAVRSCVILQLHQLSTAEFTKVQRQVEGLEGRHSLLSKELAAFKV